MRALATSFVKSATLVQVRTASRAVLERLGPPGEAPDVVASGLESGQEPTADVAGGAGEQDVAGRVHDAHGA
jgi:hypothetical protein